MSVKALAISCWLTVAAILGLVCFLSGRAEGERFWLPAEVGATGSINDGTRICEFNEITFGNVDTFNRYNSLIDKLEDSGIDSLTAIERKIGAFLTFQVGCGTISQDYRIILSRVKGDYVLFFFDLGYGFDVTQYLTWKLSFHADEVL